MEPLDEATRPPTAPAYLPRVHQLFWSVHPEFEELILGPTSDTPAALERLGPPPFPKTGFPFIGFLATVYDHVAAQAGRRALAPEEGDGQEASSEGRDASSDGSE